MKINLDVDSNRDYNKHMIMRTARDLRAWIESQKITQVDLARRVGRSKFTVNKWATGDIVPLPPYLGIMLESIERDLVSDRKAVDALVADKRQTDLFDAVPKRKRGRPRKHEQVVTKSKRKK